VRFILSPINPADVNVIEGVYPSKPRASSFPGVQGDDLFVAGNEGLAEVTSIGSGVKGLERGDWVVMKASQVGTWRSAANLFEEQLLKVPRLVGLSEVNAATMMVRFHIRPGGHPADFRFASGKPGDRTLPLVPLRHSGAGQWVIQNGANSAVRCVTGGKELTHKVPSLS